MTISQTSSDTQSLNNTKAFFMHNSLFGLDTNARYKYIKEYLDSINIASQTHYNTDLTCRNLSVFINNNSNETRVLCAHYDVVNKYNANDNTASVSILLAILRNELYNIEDRYNYLFLFTDKEERGLIGATAFCEDYDLYNDGTEVTEIINLELTGNGNVVLSDNKYGQHIVHFPISDCIAFRREFDNVTCLSLAPQELIDNNDLISLWSKCHKPEDTLDNINEESMFIMYEHLVTILQHKITI